MVTINPLTPDPDTPDAFPARRCGRWHHGALIFHANPPPHTPPPLRTPGPARPPPLPAAGGTSCCSVPSLFCSAEPGGPRPRTTAVGPGLWGEVRGKIKNNRAKSPAIKSDGCGVRTK